MSMEMVSERVCYVHCNFCNTILAVSVPCSSSMLRIVTVRCGHCGNLLTVNMTAAAPPLPPPPQLLQRQQGVGSEGMTTTMMNRNSTTASLSASASSSSSSSIKNEHDPPRTPPIPPEKKQRVPSAYNKFIKEEIQRIKATNPEITHREAFSLAAKNWAHFPRIHFGLNLESQKQANKLMDQATSGEGAQHRGNTGFY